MNNREFRAINTLIIILIVGFGWIFGMNVFLNYYFPIYVSLPLTFGAGYFMVRYILKANKQLQEEKIHEFITNLNKVTGKGNDKKDSN